MSEPTIQGLLNRIDGVERRLRRTRAVVAAAGLAFACALLAGFGAPKDSAGECVRAGRFVLVDDSGRERGILGFRDNGVGLYLYGHKPFREDSPLAIFEVAARDIQVTKPDGSTDDSAEHGWVALLNEVLPELVAKMSPVSIEVADEGTKDSVELKNIGSVGLVLRDRSGMPYVSLCHSDKTGVEFEIREPLGIEGAFDAEVKALVENKAGEGPRSSVSAAYGRSLRFQCVAAPFAPPYMRLCNNGRVVWTAGQ